MGKFKQIKARLQLSLMALLLTAIIVVNLTVKGSISLPVCGSVFALFSLGTWFIVGRLSATMMVKKEELENQIQERTRALEFTTEKLQTAMDELQLHQQKIIHQETQKSLTSIVSGFGHEINNPLTGILGYIDLMELNDDLSAYSKKRLEGIKDQAIRIKEVIGQLNWLDPELEQVKGSINLANLLEKLVKIISKEEKDIRLETDFSAEELIVKGNHFALWQVFEGAVENAVEAIKDRQVRNGHIKVVLKRSADRQYARAEIHDNGGGFENPQKAFNPFYTTKPRTRKRGIGLAIAYNIVQEHNGNIIVENNDTNGQGATVAIYLPLCHECYNPHHSKQDESNKNESNKNESNINESNKNESNINDEMKSQETIHYKKTMIGGLNHVKSIEERL
jgi:signal transduction histidine kinase